MSTPLKILLVEDNADDEHLTVRALKRFESPIEILVVRDGQQALDLLLPSVESLPSMVLLDLKLPKVSGLNVLAALKANDRTKCLPVVVLASSDEPAEVRCGYESFADSTLYKPVCVEEFTRVVKQLGLVA